MIYGLPRELAEDGKDGYNGVTVLGISFSQQG